jgi:hypothetical protein
MNNADPAHKITDRPSWNCTQAVQHHGTGKNGEQNDRDLIMGSQPRGSDQFNAETTDTNNAQHG